MFLFNLSPSVSPSFGFLWLNATPCGLLIFCSLLLVIYSNHSSTTSWFSSACLANFVLIPLWWLRGCSLLYDVLIICSSWIPGFGFLTHRPPRRNGGHSKDGCHTSLTPTVAEECSSAKDAFSTHHYH